MKGFGGVKLAQLSILTFLNNWLCLLHAHCKRCVMSISHHLWHKCTPWPTSPVCQWKWYRFGWNLSWKSVYLSEISPHSNPLPQTCRAYDNYLCIHIHSHSHTNIYHQPHCMRSLLVKGRSFILPSNITPCTVHMQLFSRTAQSTGSKAELPRILKHCSSTC